VLLATVISAFNEVITALFTGDSISGIVGASFAVFTKKDDGADHGPVMNQSSAWARHQYQVFSLRF
jgi:hypothetical protein